MKRLVTPKMCELYNIFIKSYNTVANIAAQLYIAVLERKEDGKIGKEQLWPRGKGNKRDN
jgi:hypothetical protein